MGTIKESERIEHSVSMRSVFGSGLRRGLLRFKRFMAAERTELAFLATVVILAAVFRAVCWLSHPTLMTLVN